MTRATRCVLSIRSRSCALVRAHALLAAVALGVVACASEPSERVAEEPPMAHTLHECRVRIAAIGSVDPIDQHSEIRVGRARCDPYDAPFLASDPQPEAQALGPLSRGTVGPATRSAGRISVPVRLVGNLVVVAATVNGTPATLMVDTGASVTILSKAIAERASVLVPANARLLVIRVAGGGTISVPVVPLKSLAIGVATVEDLDVGVYDIWPAARRIDGVVGGDFLRHFRVALDHDARRLTLEVRPDATAGSGAHSPPPGATPVPPDVSARDPGSAPVWAIGDRWAFRWESPRGSGTFVWTVNRVQTMDGFDCYVVTSGRREIFYRRSDLAFVGEHVDGQVEQRAVPPAVNYAWPLALGRMWEARYTAERPLEQQTDTRWLRSSVEAEETVAVPAGTFRALRIVRRHAATGAISTKTWYAPEARQFVRQQIHYDYGVQQREMTSYSVR